MKLPIYCGLPQRGKSDAKGGLGVSSRTREALQKSRIICWKVDVGSSRARTMRLAYLSRHGPRVVEGTNAETKCEADETSPE
jgi:hypothetical protein